MSDDISFNQVRYLLSAPTIKQCPDDVGKEVAFAGRSNAGKSSAINTLTNNSKLARTSKTPGRTQLLNFFSLTEDLRLVDLPGYGFAKVPKATYSTRSSFITASSSQDFNGSTTGSTSLDARRAPETKTYFCSE